MKHNPDFRFPYSADMRARFADELMFVRQKPVSEHYTVHDKESEEHALAEHLHWLDINSTLNEWIESGEVLIYQGEDGQTAFITAEWLAEGSGISEEYWTTKELGAAILDVFYPEPDYEPNEP